MDFYGFDKQNLNLPGERFGNFKGGIGTEGLIALGLIGGTASYFNNKTSAGMYERMAETNADAMQFMNGSNNAAAVAMNQQNAQASIDNTRWQVMGMMFQANTQYLQTIQQTAFADMANRRQSFTERKALSNELRAMTLQYNAYIHSMNLEHQQSMTAMQFQHDEKMKAYEQPVVNEVTIDPATLLS
ncbi:MAG: hypothetical protein HY542_07540 [Deltaproteobacteria bacterium]|nr:hypothetical protein [Deltaproteobacteria bacterium]